jgi:L-threonylcarbamoyladenylate synthase
MPLSKKPRPLEDKANIRAINPHDPDISIISEAADIIRRGGVVVFPTRNLYGLGADACSLKAIERVFQIKKRPENKPISILIKSTKDLDRFVLEIPAVAVKLMESFWPGRITLVFNARPDVPDILAAGTGKIGIRLPEHPVAVALVNMLDNPITATSANISGMAGVYQIQDLPEEFIKKVSILLDAGPLKKGKGSTVVDVTTDPPTVLREGEALENEIFNQILS